MFARSIVPCVTESIRRCWLSGRFAMIDGIFGNPQRRPGRSVTLVDRWILGEILGNRFLRLTSPADLREEQHCGFSKSYGIGALGSSRWNLSALFVCAPLCAAAEDSFESAWKMERLIRGPGGLVSHVRLAGDRIVCKKEIRRFAVFEGIEVIEMTPGWRHRPLWCE